MDEDICTGISKSNSEDDDSDGWDEMEIGSGEQTTCLFCHLQFHTIAVALNHCKIDHSFDLLALKKKYNMDCYSYIKMINYIRLQKPDPCVLLEASEALWEDDCYLKPGEMEPWLMYDFDDLGSAPSTPHYAIDGKTPLSSLNFSDLQRQIYNLNMEIRHRDMLIDNYMKDMNKMKEVTRTIIEKGDADIAQDSKVIPSDNSDYFNSYSHFGIHHEMLDDKVRTESYRNAILKNSDLFKDKIVLDLGCGTAILSMFAAQAGAAKVYGIDQSEIIYKSMDIVRENNLQDRISLIRGQIEKTNIPVDKVDVLVSEWMGYFLLFEGMLDSLIYTRNKYLKPDGLIFPNRCNMSIVGISDIDRYNKLINFWDSVYGFSMKCMKSEVLKEAVIETVPEENVITEAFVITEIDLQTCDATACSFNTKYKMKVLKDAKLTAIAGYFDTFFDFGNKLSFSTGPHAEKTHWQQTVFYLKDVLELKEGDSLEGTISCSKFKKNSRGLSITLTVKEKIYEYIVD